MLLPLEEGSSVRAGDAVVAIGYPLGIVGAPSSTFGIVSRLVFDTVSDRQLIQIDAALNPGNSGGPLLSLDGRLLGINTSKVVSVGGVPVEGVGFAVSQTTAAALLPQLRLVPTPTPTPTPTPVPSTITIQGGAVRDHSLGALAVLEGAVALSSNPDDLLGAKINWGDGGGFLGAIVQQHSGEIIATHRYGNAGIFPVSVTVLNDDGAQFTKFIGWVTVS